MFTPANPARNADNDRRIGDVAREGVVESVDLDAGKAVVRFGDELTPPIDWSMWTGKTTIWLPPTVGQQVTVTAPDGDVERAYVSGGLPSSEMAPLFLGLKVAIRFEDGALISYDPEAHTLEFQLPGEALVTAPNGARLVADVAIEGDLDVTGDVTIGKGLVAQKVVEGKEDVVGFGRSMKGHRHPSGSPLTGVAQ